MKLFKRRDRAPESASETDAKHDEPVVDAPDESAVLQEAAEERQEYDDDVESAGNRRGLNPHWSLRRDDDEVTRREVRAAADRESDTAEKLFIKAEHDAEEHGGPGFPR